MVRLALQVGVIRRVARPVERAQLEEEFEDAEAESQLHLALHHVHVLRLAHLLNVGDVRRKVDHVGVHDKDDVQDRQQPEHQPRHGRG
eukprot:7391126-Prymnesium_polylepis.3